MGRKPLETVYKDGRKCLLANVKRVRDDPGCVKTQTVMVG
jgi:hypothetical protein